MEIRLIEEFNGRADLDRLKKRAQVAARVCYSGKEVEDLFYEPYNSGLVEGRLLKSGHHSPFEHQPLTFYMDGIPKILAMVLNNERQYATCEKSARYTRMEDVVPEQKVLYGKWISELMPLIDEAYPEARDAGKEDARQAAIRKLAQENARYMTSVFTPTKMIHTLNLRQLNFIIGEFERCVEESSCSPDAFEERLAKTVSGFLDQVGEFRIEGLDNQTDRHLSLFNYRPGQEHFGDTYSAVYNISLAGLAQAQRHRTITYNMEKPRLKAVYGFFTPKVIEMAGELQREWRSDLNKVAEKDFPQAQLVLVRERGNIEDFRSKMILRLCGQAQYEIMRNTVAVAKDYAEHVPIVGKWISPKCVQGMNCAEPCAWGGKRALERAV